MTQEERELLLKDLCARLPYRVICRKDCKTVDGEDFYLDEYPNSIELAKYLTIDDMVITIKPYLRSMSSMTEEEKRDLSSHIMNDKCDEDGVIIDVRNITDLQIYYYYFKDVVDWLNSHHFDYRGLIEKGLALEAPEGMYKIN